MVMLAGISYLHGFHALLFKTTSTKYIISREIHKLRNGVIVSMCSSLKENWKRYILYYIDINANCTVEYILKT